MTPINDQAGRYHSPRGVNAFASINAAIVALGGVPVEAPTFERFARSPGGVQLLEALETLEALAGVDSPVVEQGKFFRSPRPSETFDRLNSVIVGLGGAPIDYGSGVSGAEVVAALEELTTGAEGGGDELGDTFLITQYAGVLPPIVGAMGTSSKPAGIFPVSWTRPNNVTQYAIGDHLGPPIFLDNIAPPGAFVSIGVRLSFNPRPTNLPTVDLIAFNAEPSGFAAGVDNGNFTMDLADRAKMIGFSRRNAGEFLSNEGFQPAVGAGRTLSSGPFMTFRGVLPTGDLWLVPGNFNSAYTPSALTNFLWHFNVQIL